MRDVPQDRGWSGNFIDTLKQVPAEYVLYLQEDYFLKTRVDTEKVSSALDFIRKEAGAYLRLYPVPDRTNVTRTSRRSARSAATPLTGTVSKLRFGGRT